MCKAQWCYEYIGSIFTINLADYTVSPDLQHYQMMSKGLPAEAYCAGVGFTSGKLDLSITLMTTEVTFRA